VVQTTLLTLTAGAALLVVLLLAPHIVLPVSVTGVMGVEGALVVPFVLEVDLYHPGPDSVLPAAEGPDVLPPLAVPAVPALPEVLKNPPDVVPPDALPPAALLLSTIASTASPAIAAAPVQECFTIVVGYGL
jgi:hypothetical protein